MSLSEDRINYTINEPDFNAELTNLYERINSLKQQLNSFSDFEHQKRIIESLEETIQSLRSSDLKKIELLPLIIQFISSDYDISIVISAMNIIFKYTGMKNINSMLLYESSFVSILMTTLQFFISDKNFEGLLQPSLDALLNLIINPDPVDKSNFVSALVENGIFVFLSYVLSTFCQQDVEKNCCYCITESLLCFLSNLISKIDVSADLNEFIDSAYDSFVLLLSSENYLYIQQCLKVFTLYLGKFDMFKPKRDLAFLEIILSKATKYSAFCIQESFFAYCSAMANYYIDFFDSNLEKIIISNYFTSNQSSQITILNLLEIVRCKIGILSEYVVNFLLSIMIDGSIASRTRAIITVTRSFDNLNQDLIDKIMKSGLVYNIIEVVPDLEIDEKIEVLSFLRDTIARNPFYTENYFDVEITSSLEEYLDDETCISKISQDILDLVNQ